MTMSPVEVRSNEAMLRYELIDDDLVVGFISYMLRDERYWLIHTEIDQARQGSGLSSLLIRSTLDDLRSKGVLIVPICPLVVSWIGDHPDYQDLVDTETLRSFERRRAKPGRRAAGGEAGDSAT